MPQKLLKILLPLAAAAAILAAGAVWIWYPRPAEIFSAGAGQILRVDFLDVGQGDAALIRVPSGQNILIDGGPDQAAARALERLLPFYDRTLDLIILTHPHDDHVAGLISVLERFHVEKIAYTGVSHSAPAYLDWLEAAKKEGSAMVIIDRPQTLVLGADCELRFLYPRRSLAGASVENLNDSSIVVKLVYGRTSFLFMGDAEAPVESELLSVQEDLRADILKIGHHGSNTSSQAEFLAAVRPSLAVISAGADNKFGHPSPRILNRLLKNQAKIWRTDQNGSLAARSDSREISWRPPPLPK